MSFQPLHPGVDLTIEWLYSEFRRLAYDQSSISELFFQQLSAEPERPVEGQVVYADGTGWNPGQGEGLYIYIGGSWFKLQSGQTGMASQMATGDRYFAGGMMAPVIGGQIGTLDVDQVTLWPVYIDSDMIVNKVEMQVTVGVASTSVDFNLYEFLGNGKPGEALIACTVPGDVAATVTASFTNVALTAGWYFGGLHLTGVSSPTFRGMGFNTNQVNAQAPCFLLSDPWALYDVTVERQVVGINDLDLPGGAYTLGGDLTGTTLTLANTSGETSVPMVLLVKA